MTFDLFQLHPRVLSGVKAQGFTIPTPIQHQSIPVILQGQDVLGLAQTGTGKTAAYALPILHRLMTGQRGVVRALIIAPTRELSEQIHTTIVSLGRQTGVRSTAVYGGVAMRPQVEKLRKHTDIVVACPGRLLDHISQGTIDLSHLEVLVLDEADHMFDMGFIVPIRQILKTLPKNRQTLLFSATMPDAIKGLATEILQSPKNIQIGKIAPASTVSHAIYPVNSDLKTPLLMELLRQTREGSVLVFTKTKHRAKRLDEQLRKSGYGSASLQGNLSQNQRQAALDGFRTGRHQILVATDIAARGIDVTGVSRVINYDIPDTADAYTHRIGRTGRAAQTGDALTLVTSSDEAMVRTIERTMGKKLERRKLEGFDYSETKTSPDQDFIRSIRQAQSSRRSSSTRSSRPMGRNQG